MCVKLTFRNLNFELDFSYPINTYPINTYKVTIAPKVRYSYFCFVITERNRFKFKNQNQSDFDLKKYEVK